MLRSAELNLPSPNPREAEREREACGEWWDSASGAVHGLG